jgi:hypothetical protein
MQGKYINIGIPPQTKVEVLTYDINLELFFSTFPFADFHDFSSATVANSIEVYK